MCIHEDFGPFLKEKEQTEQALDLLLFAYRDIVAIKASPIADLYLSGYDSLLETGCATYNV